MTTVVAQFLSIVVKCKGCRKEVIKRECVDHEKKCESVVVICSGCEQRMQRIVFNSHSDEDCMGVKILLCGKRVEDLELGIEEAESSFSKLEQLTKCLLLGEPLQLNIEVYTAFNQHFVFPNPTLIKPSFNQVKLKFDFFHFYILNPIYTKSIASIKWAIKINKIVGNILLGFCDSMGQNSLDFVINKYGELKKKSIDETKYKLVRKSDKGFLFGCGDIIRFRYYSLARRIRIENETKRAEMFLDDAEISKLGNTIYIFYSMDTLNDSISFL